jgi:hypothetical protein
LEGCDEMLTDRDKEENPDIQVDTKKSPKDEMNEDDRRFEVFNEDEKDLILAIALGDFRFKLEKGDIRNEVKLEIWKAALGKRQIKKWQMDLESKKILLYDKFGPRKRKKEKLSSAAW